MKNFWKLEKFNNNKINFSTVRDRKCTNDRMEILWWSSFQELSITINNSKRVSQMEIKHTRGSYTRGKKQIALLALELTIMEESYWYQTIGNIVYF